jgi:N-acetylmuramoyl-L-alanine amidase
MKTIILDPGHGMSNRRRGQFDPGAVAENVREADIAMNWANVLMETLKARNYAVVRTRVNNQDPAPVSRRDDIAMAYNGDIMISLHCNAASSVSVSGVEVFYRGADDAAMASRLSASISKSLGIRNRGGKKESQSQHNALAVLDFNKCWLIEIGFITANIDRERMMDAGLRLKACAAIADEIDAYFVQ